MEEQRKVKSSEKPFHYMSCRVLSDDNVSRFKILSIHFAAALNMLMQLEISML